MSKKKKLKKRYKDIIATEAMAHGHFLKVSEKLAK